MDPLKVKRFNLSFLDIFWVPRDTITAESLSALRNPDQYYSFVNLRGTGHPQIRAERLGRFRSGLLAPASTRANVDEFWLNLDRFYGSLAGKLGKKLPCFPYIPLILDYLPSGNRTYNLDFSRLPGSLSASSGTAGKISISTYYFPLGYAVSRTGLYLDSEGGFDPGDVSSLVNSPGIYLWASVYRRKGGKKIQIQNDFVFKIVNGLQESFYKSLVGPGEPLLLRSLGRYSIIDFVDVTREVDLEADTRMISNLVGSQSREGIGSAITKVDYQGGISIPTPRCTFIRLPKATEDDARRSYRRRIRNLAMLLLIQRSLNAEALGVDSRGLLEAVKSGSFIQQLKQMVFTPKLSDSFSFLHYLTAQSPAFGGHRSVMEMYRAMKPLIDGEGTIDKNTDNMAAYLKEVKEQVDKSGELASGIFSTILSALLPGK